MNFPDQNAFANRSGSGTVPETVEATLRLIATLPAPEGLEDRVNASLRTAQRSAPRMGRILAWPMAGFKPGRDWMRSAAAAAIVIVVAGGGWGIYSRVQPARGIAAPPRVAAPAGFSSAGAMRTPQTLNGPVVKHSVTAKTQPVKSPAKKPLHRVKPAAANKTAAQPVVPAVK
jgi:hypothetical protein